MSESQVPLREMLKALDLNDMDFYSRLSKEQKKAFSPWLAMRYASSCTGSEQYHYLLMVNDLVNVEFNTLKSHPELQWKIMSVCGIGRPVYHPWIAPGKKKKKNKVENFVRKVYPQLKRDEVELFISLNSKQDLKNLALDFGLEEKDIKEIFG